LSHHVVHGTVDRPTRERKIVAKFQMKFLKMLPDPDGKNGPDKIIHLRESRHGHVATPIVNIELAPEILGNLRGIERQKGNTILDSDVEGRVAQLAIGRFRRDLAGISPVTSGILPEAEISTLCGKGTLPLKPDKTLRATKILS